MPARILVVDDSPTIRRVVTSILAARGYDYTEAADGEVALTLLRHGQAFDLVLLDYVMPKKNGYQFCRERAELPPHQRTAPVVLMSAKGEGIRERFLEQTGAVDSIGKPFDAQALVAVIENALRGDVRLGADQLEDDDEEEAVPPPAPAPAIDESRNDDTAMFRLTPEMMRREAYPSERSLPEAARSERNVTAADAFFGEDEVPFSDHGSETTQRIDGMSLVASKLSEELTGALGTSDETLQRAIVERLSPRVMRDLFALFGEVETRSALSGSLAAFSAASILQFVVSEASSGLLWFRQGDMIVELTLGAGKVDLAHASGGPLEFRLGRYFVAAGLLGQAELDDFLASSPPESHPRRRPLGERLVAAEKISKHSLREVLSLQSSELVYEVLRWNRGSFELRLDERSELADRARLQLHTPTLVLDGLRRVERWRDLEANLGDFDDVLARIPGHAGVEDHELAPGELQVLHLADGERTVREIIAATSLSSFDACRILAQFKGSGMVVAKERA